MLLRLAASALLAVVLVACGNSGAPSVPPTPEDRAIAAGAARPKPLLAVYWESWDDTDPRAWFGPLDSVPPSVAFAEVADFEVHNGRAAFQGPYNASSLGPSAARLHARGTKIFLSIGGYSSQWGVRDTGAFLSALQNVLDANPGVFDGFDFDDENIPHQDATPQAGQREIVRLVEATHRRWPRMAISYTAFVMGADPTLDWSDDQGEDVAVLAQLAPIVSFVNVMEYTQNLGHGVVWRPSDHPDCAWMPSARDDCYRDVLEDFAALRVRGGRRLGARKVVMGLEIRPEESPPTALTPQQMQWYGFWLRTHGFRGVAIWALNRDRAGVSGYARGAFTRAVAVGLFARPVAIPR